MTDQAIRMTGIWPFPCELCKAQHEFERLIDKTRKRTTLHIWCACGMDVSITRALDADHDYLLPRAVTPERFNHYERTQCVYCRRALVGRQKRFCSHRCRMRYTRNPHKTSR